MVDEKGPVLMEVNCRPMGPALSPDFQDQAFGQHETDSALDAMLSAEKFEAICSRPYRPKQQIMDYYIPCFRPITVKAMPLKAWLKNRQTYYSDTLPDEKDLPVTFCPSVDFETMMGLVCFCGRKEDVQKDHDWLKALLDEHYEDCFLQ